MRSNRIILVQRMRIELTRVAPYAPQTYASTSSAIAARERYLEYTFVDIFSRRILYMQDI